MFTACCNGCSEAVVSALTACLSFLVSGEQESRVQKGNGYFQVPPHTPVIFGEAGGRTLFRYGWEGPEACLRKTLLDRPTLLLGSAGSDMSSVSLTCKNVWSWLFRLLEVVKCPVQWVMRQKGQDKSHSPFPSDSCLQAASLVVLPLTTDCQACIRKHYSSSCPQGTGPGKIGWAAPGNC